MKPEPEKLLLTTMKNILHKNMGGLKSNQFKEEVLEEIHNINKKSKKREKIKIKKEYFDRKLKKLYTKEKVPWLKRYPEHWEKKRSGAGTVIYFYKGQEKLAEQKWGILLNTVSDGILLAHTKEIKNQIIKPFLDQMPLVIDFSIVHPDITLNSRGIISYRLRKKMAKATDGLLPPERMKLFSEGTRVPFYDQRLTEPGVFNSPTLEVENNILWKDFFENHVAYEPNPLDLWKTFKKINEKFWKRSSLFTNQLIKIVKEEFNLPMKYPLQINSCSGFLVDLLYWHSCNHQKYSSDEAKFLLKKEYLDDPLSIQFEKKPVPSLICGCKDKPFVWIDKKHYSGRLKAVMEQCATDTNLHLNNLLLLCETSPLSDKAAEIVQTLNESKKVLDNLRNNLDKHNNKVSFNELCPFVSDKHRFDQSTPS